MPKIVLFYRDFRKFFGGHLKVWDYYNHVKHAPGYLPKIFFSRGTVWNQTNPWLNERENILPAWQIDSADILFLEGKDWLAVDPSFRDQPSVPIIHLIQHIRHADPDNMRYGFLKHRAIRICVSHEVGEALRATGQVNGPLFVIPNGIDHRILPTPRKPEARDIDLLIVGVKRPRFARLIMLQLQWILRQRLRPYPGRIELLTQKIPRTQFLDLLARSKTALFIPNKTEGFYLPALEGMALDTLVVCPDCIANRSFCLDGKNCFRPPYTETAILRATREAMGLAPSDRERFLTAARQTAARHTLTAERESFLKILTDVEQLW